MPFLNTNTVLLCLAQCMFVSGTVLLVTVGGIVGSRISPSPMLATLPMSLMVLGTAMTTIPASLLMRRWGRRVGFVGAASVGVAAALLGAWSLEVGSFSLFCLAATLVGATIAFSQQFRFAAAESVPLSHIGQAVSFILLGSVGGALLGPALAAASPEWTPAQPFRGAFLGVAGCYLVAALVLSFIRTSAPAADPQAASGPARRLVAIVMLPVVSTAILAGVVGQGVMTFVMTATPVSMHVVDGHSLGETAAVIRAHVMAMYLPSLFSGWLIDRLGVDRVLQLGASGFALTLVLGLLGHAFMHYWFALVLLGVGWNFLFVGGTTLLVSGYRDSERYQVQAVNDFSVFGTSALASLLGGAVLLQFGWEAVLISAALPVTLMIAVLSLGRTHARSSLAV